MKQEVMNYILAQDGADPIQLLFNMTVALALGLLIFVTYHLTYTGVSYSRKFNASLMMMTMVSTIVMTVISSNIALSLGMVGALSIVRFRTAIKDPRDTTFIFWCIAVGICCGVSYYLVAAIGSLYVFAVMVILGRAHVSEKRLLLIRADREAEKEVESQVYLYFKRIELQAKNSTSHDIEYIYVLSDKTLKKAEADADASVTETLYGISGVTMVNIITQNDDMSY